MLGSYIFTDPKGELYDRTAGYLKQNGYDIKVLNLVRPQYSDGYNPLMHIDFRARCRRYCKYNSKRTKI